MKKKFLYLGFIVLAIICNIGIFKCIEFESKDTMMVKMDILGEKDDIYQLLYSEGEFEGQQIHAISNEYVSNDRWQTLTYEVPKDIKYIR
ncbi:MAG: hypothetical protein RR582_08260, partial [Niameybacter sp.]